MLHRGVWLLVGLLWSGCSAEKQEESSPEIVFPGKEWKVSDPEDEGFDPTKFQSAIDTLASYSHGDGIEELVIIVRGRVVYAGDSVDKKHNIWSCSKSLTSTALGLLISEGLCRLDDRAMKYEPLLSNHYPEVTLRHLTTMTSGYSAVGTSRWDEASEDWSWTPYQPDLPLFSPGTAYCYWDEAQMMLGRVLTQVAEVDLFEYLDQRMMKPIGITNWDWDTEGSVDGIPIRNGCTGVQVSARDLARLGHLFLNRGEWEGQQLVPEDWVVSATSRQVPATLPVAETDRKSTTGSGSYGFNWWVNGSPDGARPMPDSPSKTAYMSGFNHNVCFIIPEWNMVVVRMGMDGNPEEGKHWVYNRFLKQLGLARKG